jgi:hypothetical protein
MPFSNAAYDPETLALLTRAFDEAWNEVENAQRRQGRDPHGVGDKDYDRSE